VEYNLYLVDLKACVNSTTTALNFEQLNYELSQFGSDMLTHTTSSKPIERIASENKRAIPYENSIYYILEINEASMLYFVKIAGRFRMNLTIDINEIWQCCIG
jgi:hypothetical protein